ncbi:hypothetical protein AB205_0121590 [Aquarana catesbeiana]|uniref:Uncharacterized protein n=1 Tax=Aquarana catesbeiana TaxID=8400 RepID=A0A2G9RIG9_AQUCT|nr:hypothetical protein AB205_0121590 [Aquarana catesbeiana]
MDSLRTVADFLGSTSDMNHLTGEASPLHATDRQQSVCQSHSDVIRYNAGPAVLSCMRGCRGSAHISEHRRKEQATFDDIAVYFSKDEWDYLNDEEKDLYREVMIENYQTLQSLDWCRSLQTKFTHHIL